MSEILPVMRRFEGRVAIVTGHTRGIGEVTARRLAAEGAKLVLVSRGGDELDLATETVVVRGSVSERSTAQTAVDAAHERFGRLDVLVNNAGIDYVSELLEAPEDEVRAVFETNFFGALFMLQAAAAAMSSGGSIVNVTSRLASIGVETMTVYGASKGALLSLTRGAAIDLAGRGIRVNAVAPGLTATPLYEEWISAQPDPARTRSEVEASIPQGRLGTAEDAAAAIAFLASDEAAHITGASLPVDGGYTAA